MLNQIATSNAEATMTSTQLSELLTEVGLGSVRSTEKSRINQKIREMFAVEIDDAEIASSLDSRGYVAEYHLNELYSTMFVGKCHTPFLKRLAQFWIDGRKPVQPQLPPSELQLTKEILDSAITLGMSPEQVLVLLGKQLPKPAKLPKPKKVKVEYNYINIRNLVPADQLPKVQKAMQQMTLVRMLRSGPNYGQFVLDKGRADLLNARMPNGWGSLEVREGFTDTFLKLLQI